LYPIKIIGEVNYYSIGLIDDTEYNPSSPDNVIAYGMFISDKKQHDYRHLSKHGIQGWTS